MPVPVAPERLTVKTFEPSIAVSSMTGITTDLAALSPAAQLTVPESCVGTPLAPKSVPAMAVPLAVLQLTDAASAAVPLRTMLSVRLPAPSDTVAVALENCTMLGAGAAPTIVTVALDGEATVPPAGETSATEKVSLGSVMPSLATRM